MAFLAPIIGAAFGSALVGQIITTGILIGAQALLAEKYTGNQQTRTFTAFQESVEFGGDLPRKSSFGVTTTAGHLVGYFKWGAGNRHNAKVLQLADFECDGLEEYIILDGERINLINVPTIGGEDAHYQMEGFEDYTSIRFYRGAINQQVDEKLVSDSLLGGGDGWTNTSVGTSACYVVFEYSDTPMWESIPNPQFVLRGLKCYDPRRDDTFSGGSGNHRIDDPATWEFTKNPAIQRLNYLLGYRAPLNNKAILGAGLTISQIDINSHVAAANACDAQRNVDGEFISTYECNVIFDSNDDYSETTTVIEDSMAGYAHVKGGIASVVAGAPQIPVLSITENDIRTDATITHQPRNTSDDIFNHIAGQYTNVEALYQPASYDTISVAQDVVDDKGINQVTHDFLQVTDARIAQYLATVRYRQNRLGGTATVPVVPLVYLRLNAGDWVEYDDGSGGDNTWIVFAKDQGNLVLRRESVSSYSGDEIRVGTILNVPAQPINPNLLSGLQGFGISSAFLGGADGSGFPVLTVTWTPPEDPTITSIVITYGIENSLTGERFTHVVGDPESGQTTISQNIVSGLNYVASALIVTNPDRLRIPTIELSTNTPTPQAQVSLDQHMADTLEVYNRVQADINRLRSSVQTIGTAVQAISINETIERQSVSATADRASAAIISERQVRADALEAVASTLETLSAEIDGANAAIAQEQTVRSTELESVANSLDVLSSEVDGANAAIAQEQVARTNAIMAEAAARQLALASVDSRIAEGYLDIQASVTPEGTLASADIVLRASNDDGVEFTTVGQSFTLEPDGSGGFVGRIINRADMWSLVDEDGNLIFGATSIGGENLIVSNASIISPDGNFIIDPIRQILAFTT